MLLTLPGWVAGGLTAPDRLGSVGSNQSERAPGEQWREAPVSVKETKPLHFGFFRQNWTLRSEFTGPGDWDERVQNSTVTNGEKPETARGATEWMEGLWPCGRT